MKIFIGLRTLLLLSPVFISVLLTRPSQKRQRTVRRLGWNGNLPREQFTPFNDSSLSEQLCPTKLFCTHETATTLRVGIFPCEFASLVPEYWV